MNRLLDRVVADVRHALRLLRRARGFTITAVAVLALTIGANTAVFSVVNALLLRPLPYPDADRIVQVVITHDPSRIKYTLETSIPKFFAWKANVPVLARLAAYQAADPGVSLLDGGGIEHLSALHVTQEYFAVFGVRALYGRTFKWQEDRPNGPHVAVLGYGFWMRKFGGDRRAVGRVLPLGAVSYEIVGVLPPDFEAEQAVDVYLPLQADPFSLDFANIVRVVGRMYPHITVARTGQQLSNTASEFAHKFPRSMGEWEDFWAVPLRDARVGAAKPVLRLLTGAVTFVLLVGCANISVLLLARGYRRRREIVTRTALGAPRASIVQQLLIESALLAAAGGALGLVAGAAALQAIIRAAATAFPNLATRPGVIALDGHVLWFTVAVTIATGILFGVLPALTTSRVDLSSAFRGDGVTGETRTGSGRLQPILVVLEMALAIVLLVGCGLMVRTLVALRHVDRGFDPSKVVAVDFSLIGSSLQDSAGIASAVETAKLRLASVPGVVAAAAARALPLEPAFALPFSIDRRPVDAPFEGNVVWRGVSPGYFDVFHIPVLRGRSFEDRDNADGTPVVIVNAALARRYWQRNDPVGERITIGRDAGPEFREGPRQIVGVVADPRDEEANRDPVPTVYVPLAQVPDAMTARNNRLFPLTWVVRTSADSRPLTMRIEQELRGATGGLPVARTRSLVEILAGPAERAAFQVRLMVSFALIALVLAVVGFYGLMSYSVQQRTQEIGIRIALGALPGEVRRMVLAEGFRLTAAGVVIGIGASLVLTRVMTSLIFGVRTYDPAVFAGVTVLLCAAALVAALVPAHRATRVNPLDAVRSR
jgi:predicted permease